MSNYTLDKYKIRKLFAKEQYQIGTLHKKATVKTSQS
jgi:hypothetical protein